MHWPDKVRCFGHLQSHVVSVFLPLIFIFFVLKMYCLNQNFSSNKTFLVFIKGTCAPLSNSLCSLSHLCSNVHSLLLNSYLSELRIVHAAPMIIQLRTLLISFCLVLLWTLSATCFLVLFLNLISGAELSQLPNFWSFIFCGALIP